MATSMFTKPVKNPLDNFDFTYVDYLFIENRLADWFGEKKRDGSTFTSLDDFLQPNYLPTQRNAFFWGLDTMPDELNFSWICELHRLSTLKLLHEGGTPIPHTVRREFTYLDFPSMISQLAYGSADKASPEGIESLFKELCDLDDEETQGKVIFALKPITLEEDQGETGEAIDVETAKKYYAHQQALFAQHLDFFKSLLAHTIIQPGRMFTAGIKFTSEEKLVTQEVIKKIIEAGYGMLLTQVGYCLLNRNPFRIRAKAEKMIKAYNQSPKANDDEKIDAIVILVKGLLNLHVWPDGNGRLCAHQLLNLLLIKNRLPPALLKNNCLDAFSLPQLRQRVKDGIVLFNSKRTKQEGMLKQYREEHQLPVAVESKFIQAILDNRIDDAKKYLLNEELTLTNKELDFFATCSQAHIDWLSPYFSRYASLSVEGEPHTWGKMIGKLISLALTHANENLLCSVIEFSMSKNIILSAEQLDSVITYGTRKSFQLLKPLLSSSDAEIKVDRYLRLILACRDVSVNLTLMDKCFQDEANQKAVNYYFIDLMFQRQQAPVIMRLLDLQVVKEYFASPLSTGMLTKNLLDSIRQRVNLTVDEKQKILQKINPALKFEATDVLASISPSSVKVIGNA